MTRRKQSDPEPWPEPIHDKVRSFQIRKLVSDRGFGFIASEDGKEYFFHRSGTEGDFDTLQGGDKVTFEIEQTPKGPRAKSVRLRLSSKEHTEQLNAIISELIKENRKLKRQVDKLTAGGSSSASSPQIEPLNRRQSKTRAAATSRRRAVPRKREKST